MQYRFFHIPAIDPAASTEELNQFLRQHRALTTEREFVADGANSYWTVCVRYATETLATAAPAGKGGIDYREVLNEQDFTVFVKLRALRKELSAKERVPAYALFTNEQLAAMVRERVVSKASLLQLAGVGETKVTKYGDVFLKILIQSFGDDKPAPDSASEQK